MYFDPDKQHVRMNVKGIARYVLFPVFPDSQPSLLTSAYSTGDGEVSVLLLISLRAT